MEIFCPFHYPSPAATPAAAAATFFLPLQLLLFPFSRAAISYATQTLHGMMSQNFLKQRSRFSMPISLYSRQS
jgi:hypothetical protein